MRKIFSLLFIVILSLCLLPNLASADDLGAAFPGDRWNDLGYAYTPLQALDANIAGAQKIASQYGGIDTLNYCSCLVTAESLINDDKETDIFRIYKNGSGSTGLQNGNGTFQVDYNVDLNNNICQVTSRDKILFDAENCKIKSRVNCCCDVDKGNYSSKYSNCSLLSNTIDSVTGACLGTTLQDDGQECASYEGKVVPNSSTSTVPNGTPGSVTISTDTLLAQASDLNKLGVTNVNNLIGRVVQALLAFIGMILLVFYIYAGLLWMTAAGNDEQIAKSKNMLVWATLGVAVMLGSYVIVSFIFKTALQV